MRLILLTFLCAVVVVQAELNEELMLKLWETFKVEYNRTYINEEEERFRREIFASNSLFIAEHNDLYAKGVVSYSVDMNKFGDLTEKEMQNMYGYKSPLTQFEDNDNYTYYLPPENMRCPDSIDWRRKGAVSKVKDQGTCASCYAFSALGALEGQHFRKNRRLIDLSAQNIVDCTINRPYNNAGCNGGWPEKVYGYAKDNGVDTDSSYPYEHKMGKCRFQPKYIGAKDKSFTHIKRSEKHLMSAIASVGPVSVVIDANGRGFTFYSRGIYYNPTCTSWNGLNHAVLAVGYGEIKGRGKYWTVKNSWGTNWGMHGYIVMARERNNNCGIASDATYPNI